MNYGVQFCEGQTRAVGRLALASAWVEDGPPAALVVRPQQTRVTGELNRLPGLMPVRRDLAPYAIPPAHLERKIAAPYVATATTAHRSERRTP